MIEFLKHWILNQFWLNLFYCTWAVTLWQWRFLFTHLNIPLNLVAIKWDQVLTWQTFAEAIFPQSLKKAYFIFYHFTKQAWISPSKLAPAAVLAYRLTYDFSTVQHGHADLGQRGGNNPYLSCYGGVDRAHAAFAHVRVVRRTSQQVEHMELGTCRRWI